MERKIVKTEFEVTKEVNDANKGDLSSQIEGLKYDKERLRERVKELESQLTKYRKALERVLQSLQSRRPYTPGLGAPINIIRSVLEQEVNND